MDLGAHFIFQGTALSPILQDDNVLPITNSHVIDIPSNPGKPVTVMRDSKREGSSCDDVLSDLSSMKSNLANWDKITDNLPTVASDLDYNCSSKSICKNQHGTKNDLIVNFNSVSCSSHSNHINSEEVKSFRFGSQTCTQTDFHDNERNDLHLPYGFDKFFYVPNFMSYPLSPFFPSFKTGSLAPNQEVHDSRSFSDSGYNSSSAQNSNRAQTQKSVMGAPSSESSNDGPSSPAAFPEAVPCISLNQDSDLSDVDLSADLRKKMSSQDENVLLSSYSDTMMLFSNDFSVAESEVKSVRSVDAVTCSRFLTDSTLAKSICPMPRVCCFKNNGFSDVNFKDSIDSHQCEDGGEKKINLDEYLTGRISFIRAELAVSAVRLRSEVETKKSSSSHRSKTTNSVYGEVSPLSNMRVKKLKITTNRNARIESRLKVCPSWNAYNQHINDHDLIDNGTKKASSSQKNSKRACSKVRSKKKDIDCSNTEVSPPVYWSVKVDEGAVNLGKKVVLTFKKQFQPDIFPCSSKYSTSIDSDKVVRINKPTCSVQKRKSVDDEVKIKTSSPGFSSLSAGSESTVSVFGAEKGDVPMNQTLIEKSQQEVNWSTGLSMTKTHGSDKSTNSMMKVSKLKNFMSLGSKNDSVENEANSGDISIFPACPHSLGLGVNSEKLEEPLDLTLSEKFLQNVRPSPNPLMTRTHDIDLSKSCLTKASVLKSSTSAGSKVEIVENKLDSRDISVPSAGSHSLGSDVCSEKLEVPVNLTVSEKSQHKVCLVSKLPLAKTNDYNTSISSVNKVLVDTENFTSLGSEAENKENKKNNGDIDVLLAISQSIKLYPALENQVTQVTQTSSEKQQQKLFCNFNISFPRRKAVILSVLEHCQIIKNFSEISTLNKSVSSSKNPKNIVSEAENRDNEIDSRVLNAAGSPDPSVSPDVSQFPMSHTSVVNCEVPVTLILPEKARQKVCSDSSTSVSESRVVTCDKKRSKKKSIFSLKNFIMKKSTKTLRNFLDKKKCKKINKIRHSSRSTSPLTFHSSKNSGFAENIPMSVNLTSSAKPQHKICSSSNVCPSKLSDSDSVQSLSEKSTSSSNAESADSKAKINEPEIESPDFSILSVSPSSKSSVSSGNFSTPKSVNLNEKNGKHKGYLNSNTSMARTKDCDIFKSTLVKSTPSFQNSRNIDRQMKIKIGSPNFNISPAVSQSLKSRKCFVNLGAPIDLIKSGKPLPKVGQYSKVHLTKDRERDTVKSVSKKLIPSKNCSNGTKAESEEEKVDRLNVSTAPTVVQPLNSKNCDKIVSPFADLTSTEKPVQKVCLGSRTCQTKNNKCDPVKISLKKSTSTFEKIRSADMMSNNKVKIGSADINVSAAVRQSLKSKIRAEKLGTSVNLSSSEKPQQKVGSSSKIQYTKEDGRLVQNSLKKPVFNLKNCKKDDSEATNKEKKAIMNVSSVVSQSLKSNICVKNPITPVLTLSGKTHQKVGSSAKIHLTKSKYCDLGKSSLKKTSTLKNFKSTDEEAKNKKSTIGQSDNSVVSAASQSLKSNIHGDSLETPRIPTSQEKPLWKSCISSCTSLTKRKVCDAVESSSKKSISDSINSESKAKSKKSGVASRNLNVASTASKPSKSVMFAENFGKPIILASTLKPPGKIQSISNPQSVKDKNFDPVKCSSEKATSDIKIAKGLYSLTKNKNDDGVILPKVSYDVPVSKSACNVKSLSTSVVDFAKVSPESKISPAKNMGSSVNVSASCSVSEMSCLVSTETNHGGGNSDKCSTETPPLSHSKSEEKIDEQEKDGLNESNSGVNLSLSISLNSKTTTLVLNSSVIGKKIESFTESSVSPEHLEKSIEELASDSQPQVEPAQIGTSFVPEGLDSGCTSKKVIQGPVTPEKVSTLITDSTDKNNESPKENIPATAFSTSVGLETFVQDSNSAADCGKNSSVLKPKLSLAAYLGRSNSKSQNRDYVDIGNETDSCSLFSNESSNLHSVDDNDSANPSRKGNDASQGGILNIVVGHSLTNNEILKDKSFEKVISDASKKLSSSFSSKFLNSIPTQHKPVCGVSGLESPKLIPDEDSINNNYKASCAVDVSPDKIPSDQQKAKITDNMSPKINTFEDTINKNAAIEKTNIFKSVDPRRMASCVPYEKSMRKKVTQEAVSNLKTVPKRPWNDISSNLKSAKKPREMLRKPRVKMKWLLHKIDLKAPEGETLSSKFCRLGCILPYEKILTTSVDGKTCANESVLKDHYSKLKPPVPEKSESGEQNDTNAKIDANNREKSDDFNSSSSATSRLHLQIDKTSTITDKSFDLPLSLKDVNDKLQDAVNFCRSALKRKCEKFDSDGNKKISRTDSTSQNDSASNNPSGTSCVRPKVTRNIKSSLLNKCIQLNSPPIMKRQECVITLDESSFEEDSDDDSVLSLTTTDIQLDDNGVVHMDNSNKIIEIDITDESADINSTNKTLDINSTSKTINLNVIGKTINIGEIINTDAPKETADVDVANGVVDMNISPLSLSDDDRRSPSCIEGPKPAEYLCKPINHKNSGVSIKNIQLASSRQTTLSPIEIGKESKHNCQLRFNIPDCSHAEPECVLKAGETASYSLEAPLLQSKSPDLQASLPLHDNFSIYQSYLPSVTSSQSATQSLSLFSPCATSPHAAPDFQTYQSLFSGNANFSQYQSFLHSSISNSSVHFTSLDRKLPDVSIFNKNHEEDCDYLKPTNDYHYAEKTAVSLVAGDGESNTLVPTAYLLDTNLELASSRHDAEDSVHSSDSNIGFGEPSRTKDPACASPYEANSQQSDQSVLNFGGNMDLGMNSARLPVCEIACSRIPLPGNEIFFNKTPSSENEISSFGIPENQLSFSRILIPENVGGKMYSTQQTPVVSEIETKFIDEGVVCDGSDAGPIFEALEDRGDLMLKAAPSTGQYVKDPLSEVAGSANNDDIKEAEKRDHLNPAWDFWKKLYNDKDRYRGVRMVWKNLRIPNPKLNLTIRNSQKRNGFAPILSEMQGLNANPAVPTIPCEKVFTDQVEENMRKYNQKIDEQQDQMEYELQTQSLNRENELRNCSDPEEICNVERRNSMTVKKTKEFFGKQYNALVQEREANAQRLRKASDLTASFFRFYDNLDGEEPKYSMLLTQDDYEEIMEDNAILKKYNEFYK